MTEQKGGSDTREEGDANPRAIERVKDFVQERRKMTEKQKGILHREQGKFAAEERQLLSEGVWSPEKGKANLGGGAGKAVGAGCTGVGGSEQAGPHT